MYGKEYECRDCGRAFRVNAEKKVQKCPGCESTNTAPKQKRPMPQWMCKQQAGSG